MQIGADRQEAIRTFLDEEGWGDAGIAALPGDASTRRYFRVRHGGRHALLMDQPQAAEAPPCPPDASPDERRRLGYNAVARLAGADCGRFIAAADFLRRRGLSAPEIFAADTVSGFVLLEDLGENLFTDVLDRGHDEAPLYEAAVEALARLQSEAAPAVLAAGKPLYAYDETAQIAEVDLVTDWFLPHALGRPAHADEIEEHRGLWRALLGHIARREPVFVHRDYHAQNLIWIPRRDGIARVGVIDFQDAVAGRKSYDLISLIEDARRDVPAELAIAVTEHYFEALRANGVPVEPDAHRMEMAVMAAQRNAKIAGIFARLARRDGKMRYLDYLPRVWRYLERDLAHPGLAQLRAWYDRVLPREVRGQNATTEAVP